MEPFSHGNVSTEQQIHDQPRSIHEPVHEDSDDGEDWLKKNCSFFVDDEEAGIRLYQVGVFQIPVRLAHQTEQQVVSKKPRLRLPNPPLRRPKSSPSSSSEASEMPPAIMKAKPSSEASMLRPRPKPKAGPTEVSSKTETSKSQVTSEPKDELEEWTVLEDKPVGQHE